ALEEFKGGLHAAGSEIVGSEGSAHVGRLDGDTFALSLANTRRPQWTHERLATTTLAGISSRPQNGQSRRNLRLNWRRIKTSTHMTKAKLTSIVAPSNQKVTFLPSNCSSCCVRR